MILFTHMGHYITKDEREEEFLRRAISAHFRYGAIDMPSKNSGFTTIKGKEYVVLVNGGGILSVYRVRNDGVLKKLKRYPEEIDKWEY